MIPQASHCSWRSPERATSQDPSRLSSVVTYAPTSLFLKRQGRARVLDDATDCAARGSVGGLAYRADELPRSQAYIEELQAGPVRGDDGSSAHCTNFGAEKAPATAKAETMCGGLLTTMAVLVRGGYQTRDLQRVYRGDSYSLSAGSRDERLRGDTATILSAIHWRRVFFRPALRLLVIGTLQISIFFFASRPDAGMQHSTKQHKHDQDIQCHDRQQDIACRRIFVREQARSAEQEQQP